ncbi:MAG: pyridoxamine 5'-phosphate oxidase family protein [Muribaculaceae bacterium]|nr:pyridoxamine 5'-phosphate oxidase family protein [Muribaculaceae bacterium]
MRKASRQLSADEALEIFDRAPYVTMSMCRPSGIPYGLPLSIVRKDSITFYFHCAYEGEKLDCIRQNPVVSLSAVSKCTPAFEFDKMNYTEHYRSAVALGRCEQVENREEKIDALRLLCQRFLPKYMEFFDDAISRSLDRTAVFRITLTEPPVGKCKQ